MSSALSYKQPATRRPRAVTCGKGTVSTNVADYPQKDLETALINASVTTSVQLQLIENRKTVLGAYHADHEKLVMTEEQLAQAPMSPVMVKNTGVPMAPVRVRNTGVPMSLSM
jgi:hypothetical protein